MTEGNSAPALEVEELLQRLEDARSSLAAALNGADPDQFAVKTERGESIKRTLERSADDLNFYYGRLVARAMSLPQPPCLQKADFASLREATTSLQVAHRRFSNLLHDLVPSDLERQASDPELGSYSMRQILEMATAHYNLRAQQVLRLLEQTAPAHPEVSKDHPEVSKEA
jgi:hypothetical protein